MNLFHQEDHLCIFKTRAVLVLILVEFQTNVSFLTSFHSVQVIFTKMSSVEEKRGLESIGSSHSCLQMWFLENQKISNSFFDLTYGCYNIIQCQSFLRDTYEVSTCAIWKENIKKKLKIEIFNKISFFRFVTSFQFDDNCNVSK